MRLLLPVFVPIVGAVSLLVPIIRARALTVLVGSAAVVMVVALYVAMTPATPAETYLQPLVLLDATSQIFLAVVDTVFFTVSVYVWGRVASTPELRPQMARFSTLALLFLGASNAVLLSKHLTGTWIALEATTLAAAPLIVRPASPSSVRASFRYVVFSAVGLGLAFLGLLCFERGAEVAGVAVHLDIDGLATMASSAAGPWMKLGLALSLLGLGTKLGLAPMYSWLPEVYDEAPPAVAALLGAVQFNCALVMLFRIVQAFRPTLPGLIMGQLLTMGVVSIAVSTASIIATRNMKRLVAYASINHAGVIAIGLGLRKGASFGLLIYVLSNAFIKAILFLTAGKIKAHYGTKDTRQIAGLIKDLPYSGVFLMVGTFALLGFPPFGSFVGELLILSALVGSGEIIVFAAFCVLMAMTFVATGRTIFPMIWGEAKSPRSWPRQTFLSAAPKVALLVGLVVLGVYVPPGINTLLQAVATSLEAP
jgi:hydrogenase-4 component F